MEKEYIVMSQSIFFKCKKKNNRNAISFFGGNMKIRNIIGVLIIAIIIFSGSLLHAASVYYVDSARPDDLANGESWEMAFKTIQAGINAANLAGLADSTPKEARVKAGVYTPATHGESFVLKQYVKLYGGFSGAETELSQRNPETSHTILSGDINGDDQWIDNWGVADDGAVKQGVVITDGVFKAPENGWLLDITAATDNCTVVVSIPANSNLDTNTTLDGFIITGGFNDATGPDMYGSGIYNEDDNSVLTIANCTVSGNTIVYTGDANSDLFGAGISSRYGGNTLNISSGTLQANAIISTPTAKSSRLKGAAIYNYESELNLSDCTITGNISRGVTSAVSSDSYLNITGAIIYNSGADSEISGCSVTDNMAVADSYDDTYIHGTGLFNEENGDNLVIENSSFSRNTTIVTAEDDNVDTYGGGFENEGVNVTVSNCIINDNSTTAVSIDANVNVYGGGIRSNGKGFTISECSVDNNTVSATAKGYITIEGAGFYNIWENLTFSNSSVSNNKVTATSTDKYVRVKGGGCYLSSKSSRMSGCSVNNNIINIISGSSDSSQNASCQGGGVFLWNGPYEILNSTISGNSVSVSSENVESSIYGGGICSAEDLFMTNTTLADNKSVATSTSDDAIVLGGGFYQNSGSGKIALVINSILWGNDISATADNGTATINGPEAYDAFIRYSVVQYGYPTGTDIITSGPVLGAIADNGGNTKTMALGTDSEAVDAGVVCYQDSDNIYFYSVPSTSSFKEVSDNSDYTPSEPYTILNPTDQRGATRPQSYFTDLGAYELGGVYTLTFSTDDSGGGTLSGETSQTITYYHNSSVVAAVPSGGFIFIGWTGDYEGVENPLTLKTVTANMTLQANFERVSPDFPTVTTAAATDIDYTGVVVGGDVTGTAWSDVTARGVCYSTVQVPTIDDAKTINGEGTGSFTSTLENLDAGITYYLRAYATNSAGTAYGEQVSFTTLSSLPIVETLEISAIGETIAQSGGSVTFNGGLTITSRGICWSRSEEPTLEAQFTTDGSGTGEFTSSMEGLSETTTYYVRAYATNKKGTAYGEQQTFTTTALSEAIPGTSSGSGGGCFIGAMAE